MIPRVRAVAIDDEEEHLEIIQRAVTELSIGCIPLLHPTSTSSEVLERYDLGSIRLVICDLHLGSEASMSNADAKYSQIGALIVGLKLPPFAPYVLLLWTSYPEEVNELERRLVKLLQPEQLPLALFPVDKGKYEIDGKKGPPKSKELWADLGKLLEGSRGLNALLMWELGVLTAADNTVRKLAKIARTNAPQGQLTLDDQVDSLLTVIAQRATSVTHTRDFPRLAAGDGLFPILADELQHQVIHSDAEAGWKNAMRSAAAGKALEIKAAEGNALNAAYLISFDENRSGAERGSVLKVWHSDAEFEQLFGRKKSELGPFMGVKKGWKPEFLRYIQLEGLCDAVQQKRGMVVFVLGAELDESAEVNTQTDGIGARPRAVEISPAFALKDGSTRKLAVNVRYFFTVERSQAKKHDALYRIRESLASQWAFAWATHSVRPGIVSF